MHQIGEPIEAEVMLRPSAIEFEMAYQARIAIGRIKFAIKHTEQFSKPCIYMREAGLQLLNALAAKNSGVHRFIHTSTSEVYGTVQYVPIDEHHPLTPQSPYSASKIGADAMALSFYYAFS